MRELIREICWDGAEPIGFGQPTIMSEQKRLEKDILRLIYYTLEDTENIIIEPTYSKPCIEEPYVIRKNLFELETEKIHVLNYRLKSKLGAPEIVIVTSVKQAENENWFSKTIENTPTVIIGCGETTFKLDDYDRSELINITVRAWEDLLQYQNEKTILKTKEDIQERLSKYEKI